MNAKPNLLVNKVFMLVNNLPTVGGGGDYKAKTEIKDLYL